MPRKTPARLGSWLLAPLEWLLRALLWLAVRAIYRLRIVGRENVPRTGPALLVCNHVSWLDGLFILLALRRRVRFLVWAPYTQMPLLRWLLRLARAIPIAGEAGPRAIVGALREASDALAHGELVGIFAEGGITRTGFLLTFRRGFEQILKKTPVPIIPTCLDRLWGSIFSYQGGRILWKRPRRWRYPVTVAFGKPMPPDSKSWQVRQEVQKLLADAFKLRKDERKPAHRQFVRVACRYPFRPCLTDPGAQGRKLNYAQTLTAAVLLARRLRQPLHNTPMVGLLLPTTLGGALANIAVALLGKTAVNLNYTASREAILSAIGQCNIRQVLTARAFRQKLGLDLGPNVKLIYLEDLLPTFGKFEKFRTYLGIVCLPGFVTEYLTLGLGRHRVDAVASVIFSSGTTGEPKGIMLSHDNVVANIESMSQAIDPLPDDRLLGVLPFFHSFGYTATLWLPLLVGASVIYYPDPRQAKEIGEICKRYHCTLLLTTPTFLRFYLRRCDKDDFRSLRLLICGAEKLPQALAEEFQQKFGILPLEGYGCTELSPVACVNVPDQEVDGTHQIGNKPGTIGQPIPGVAAMIADRFALEEREEIVPLPPGEDGMLLIYGPNVMVGYLNRPEETRKVIRDGWYVTGDIARMDEDGFITITDRISRFSKIGGEMVPHQRVEDEIHRILQTTERVVAVAGVPDERKGERLIVLYTSLNGVTPQQLHQQLVSSGLPNLWLPDPTSYFHVSELPVLGSGKLDLQRVKKLATELAAKTGG